MKKITSIDDLQESILLLEFKLANEGAMLKEQFKITYKSLKPINILKSSFKEVMAAPDLKSNILNAAIGLTTGFVAKKLFIGKSHNPLTKLLGIILEGVIANKVAKNADGIKSIGSTILNKIVNQKHDSEKI